jgi:hypothetical protein
MNIAPAPALTDLLFPEVVSSYHLLCRGPVAEGILYPFTRK